MNHKKTFSKIGLAFSVYTVLLTFLSIAVVSLTDNFISDDINIKLLFSFLIQYAIMMPLLIYILSALPKTDIKRYKLKIKDFIKLFIMLFPLSTAGNILGRLLNGIISKITNIPVLDVMSILFMRVNPVILIIFVGIIGPIMEEFITRKILIDRTVQYGEGVAILLSAGIFSLMHGNFFQSFYAFFLGACFSYIYIRTGRLRYSTIMHILINSSSIFLMTALRGSGLSEYIGTSSENIATDPLFIQSLSKTNMFFIIIIMLYLIIYLALIIAGIVLWIFHYRSIKINGGLLSNEDNKNKAKIMFVNVGMIIFILISVYNFADSIFLISSRL